MPGYTKDIETEGPPMQYATSHTETTYTNELDQDAAVYAYELGCELRERHQPLPQKTIKFELENNGVVKQYTIYFDMLINTYGLKTAFLYGYRGL